MLLYQILAFITHQKIQKSHTKAISLKHHLKRGMKNLYYLTDHIQYQIFKSLSDILSLSSKSMKHLLITLQ